MQTTTMRRTITIRLPESLKRQLDGAATADGVSRSDLMRQSLREHLFASTFISLRHKMIAAAKSQGIVTDKDFFDRMS